MKIVLDTNVVISGIFFKGTPARILQAWRLARVTLVVSPEILGEYRRVGAELSLRYIGVDAGPMLDLITIHSEIIEPLPLAEPVCRDKDDDKFLACAAAAHALLVSGDKDLLSVDAAIGVRVLSPHAFVRQFLMEGEPKAK